MNKKKPDPAVHAHAALSNLEVLLRGTPPARDVELARRTLTKIISTASPIVLRFLIVGLRDLAERGKE